MPKIQGDEPCFDNSIENKLVELKASSDNVGESFGTAEFIDKDGTLKTNAHVVIYTRLGTVHQFDEYSIRFVDEENYHPVELIKYDVELDIRCLSE